MPIQNIIIALISTSDLQYGISRVYQAYVGDSGFLTEVFRDRKSAEEWIKNRLKKSNQLKLTLLRSGELRRGKL